MEIENYVESTRQTPDGFTPDNGRPPAHRDRAEGEREITDDLEALLIALPPVLLQRLQAIDDRRNLLEIVMDLGRTPEARYHGREALLSESEVTASDIEYVVQRIGNFGEDNRAGIERTLHRISCIRNRTGKVVGLTCRIGRAVFGTISIIRDLVESGKSILLLGPPGVGKTTLLREVARVLADEFGKRVVIVDTSNEIAGDGDIPHPAIGRARRMQVPSPSRQHAVMIEAVENHMPEVIVIDEIGTELEAAAARTIAERGVQLVGTAHGSTLENLMLNPTLSDLIGGIQTVTLGDDEARRRGTQKSVLERKAPPTFDVMVEILDRDRVAVHLDVSEVVDSILRGQPLPPEIRERHRDGRIETRPGQFEPRRDSRTNGQNGGRGYQERQPERGGYANRRERRASSRGAAPSMGAMQMGPGPTRMRNAAGDYADRGERRAAPAYQRPPPEADDEDEPEEDLDAQAAAAMNAPVSGRAPGAPGSSTKPLRIYPFGVSRDRLEQAVGTLNIPVSLVKDISDADVVITLKNYYRKKPSALRQAEEESLPVYVLKSNTAAQMQQILASIFELPLQGTQSGPREEDPVTAALYETEAAITHALETGRSVELPPANAYIRRLQHQMADRYNLGSQSRGREPNRRVLIYPQD